MSAELSNSADWAGSALLPLSTDEQVIFEFGSYAVAAAVEANSAPSPAEGCAADFVESLTSNDGRWRLLLHQQLAARPEVRRGLLGFLLGATPNIPPETFSLPRAIQRRNGLMDILELGFSAEDVTAGISDIGHALMEAGEDKVAKRAAGVARSVGKTIVSVHGAWRLNGLIDQAVDRVNTGADWDDLVERCAQFVVAGQASEHAGDTDSLAVLGGALAGELAEASRALAELKAVLDQQAPNATDGQRQRIASRMKQQSRAVAVLRAALELLPAARGTARRVPDVVGVQLPDALHTLEALGFEAEARDASGTRMILNKNNWQVHEQSPTAGAPVDAHAVVALLCRNVADIQAGGDAR